MRRRIVLEGEKFGRLVVVSEAPTIGRRRFRCRCECGAELSVLLGSMSTGKTQSCGCLNRERTSNSRKKHGMSQSSEYSSWKGMIQRCTNENDSDYPPYGGSGITVCDRWKSFEWFLLDMGRKPGPKHSIDRFPDMQGNYESTNCRWATPEEQALNRSITLMVMLDGNSVPLVAACRRLGFNYYLARSRKIHGWDDSRLFVPANGTGSSK